MSKSRHKADKAEFYFDLIKRLAKDIFKFDNNHIILAKRGKSNDTKSLKEALQKSLIMYQKRRRKKVDRKFHCSIMESKCCSELSVTDYMIWALQRYIYKKDDKYFKLLENKYVYIFDIYDYKHYNKRNKFRLEKATPF